MVFKDLNSSTQVFTIGDPQITLSLEVELDEDATRCTWANTQTYLTWAYPTVDAI